VLKDECAKLYFAPGADVPEELQAND